MEELKNDAKIPARSLMGKTIVSKAGRKFGEVEDILFETQNGELMNIIVKNATKNIEDLGLERNKEGQFLVPFHAVVAMGDFLVIDEENLF